MSKAHTPQRHSTHRRSALLATGLFAMLVGALAFGPFVIQTGTAQDGAAGSLVQGLPDFTALVEQAGPAVVNISAVQSSRRRAAGGYPDEEIPEIFRRFFGMPGAPGMPGGPNMPMPQDSVSVGTGFLVSSDGYVLTNHHVVAGADEVIVRLADRRELVAEVVGSDEQSDVAVLKLDEHNLPAMRLGSSAAVKAGQWVVAIGSPFGFEHSVTAGIVSATGRSSQIRGQQYVPFIQTDVPINRGNSGGPLLNTRGEVVGINSQIFSNTGGYMGVSFAIPIETAMSSFRQLKAQGFVSRGLLGVEVQEVTRDIALGVGLTRPGGALISDMVGDSAAQRAGLEVGDVIVGFDGEEIASRAQLQQQVGAKPPGEIVKINVIRDGRERSFEVKLDELPRSGARVASRAPARFPTADNALGLAVAPLSADDRRALGLGSKVGVVVTAVESDGARRAQLMRGDVVLRVGEATVGSVAEFDQAVAAVGPDRPVMLLVRRGDLTQFVAVKPRRG